MLGPSAENSFFSQKVTVKKKYTNRELNLFRFFNEQTKIDPQSVIIYSPFIFFFVNNSDYFKAKTFLKKLRTQLREKTLIIRGETTLKGLIFSFFPDVYIHDIKLEKDQKVQRCILNVSVLSFEERGIAIGANGEYIKIINELFKKYITFERKNVKIIVKCNLVQL